MAAADYSSRRRERVKGPSRRRAYCLLLDCCQCCVCVRMRQAHGRRRQQALVLSQETASVCVCARAWLSHSRAFSFPLSLSSFSCVLSLSQPRARPRTHARTHAQPAPRDRTVSQSSGESSRQVPGTLAAGWKVWGGCRRGGGGGHPKSTDTSVLASCGGGSGSGWTAVDGKCRT